MISADSNLKATLKSLLRGRVCIVGVGNRQRGDDGAGSRLIDTRCPATPGIWLDAGAVPENLLEPIVRSNPDTVLIVDAIAFGGQPGEFRLMDTANDTFAISTHAGSLSMLCEYLSLRTAAQTFVLGIQPKRISLGAGLSPSVEASVRELAAVLSNVLMEDGP